MKNVLPGMLAVALSCPAFAKDPNCAYPDGWAASMAQGQLEDAGFFRAKQVDFTKSTVTELGAQKVGKDLYRQVHLVRFVTRAGEVIQAITVNNASNQECSMGGVEVYPVSKKIGSRSDALGRPLPVKLQAHGPKEGR